MNKVPVNCKKNLVILQCTSQYPSKLNDVGLNVISEIKKKFKCKSGLSDHSGSVFPGITVISRNEDFLEDAFVASNHDYLLFFTNKGQCFWLRVYEIPEGVRTSKGRAIQNLINIGRDEKIMAFVNTKDLKVLLKILIK